MVGALRLLIVMPLLGAVIVACGPGTVAVAPAADPPANSGSSSGISSSSSSSGSTSSGGTSSTDVLTYHNDSMRTGQNLTETTLTPANVTSASFGLLHLLAADGLVDAAPLVVSQLSIGGALHNVVYVATENDSVYTYDADSGTLLTQVSLLANGEVPSDSRSCTQVVPQIGITSTPVIDRSAGPNGTMYVVAMSKDSGGTYYQRLHALDLVTLADRMTPVAIQATYPGAPAFVPDQYKERGALLLAQGQVFTVFASHCDGGSYNGWIMAYNAATLAQTAAIDLTPKGNQGGIWDVAGLALDSTGSIYTLLGNGTFDTTLTAGFPVNQDYGNAAVRLTLSGTTFTVADYFTSWNTTAQSNADTDLGSGSPLLIPDQVDSTGTTRHLMLAAGKDMNLYLLNRDNMGKYNGNAGTSTDLIYQELPAALSNKMFSAPVYFNGSIYFADAGGTLKQYAFSAATLPAVATSNSATSYGYPGASPAISANGSSNAIVWAVESSVGSAAVLHAYNPANLAVEYYNSTQAAASRDAFGNGNKYITPVIANGKVFVGTPSGVAVFGLL